MSSVLAQSCRGCRLAEPLDIDLGLQRAMDTRDMHMESEWMTCCNLTEAGMDRSYEGTKKHDYMIALSSPRESMEEDPQYVELVTHHQRKFRISPEAGTLACLQ